MLDANLSVSSVGVVGGWVLVWFWDVIYKRKGGGRCQGE